MQRKTKVVSKLSINNSLPLYSDQPYQHFPSDNLVPIPSISNKQQIENNIDRNEEAIFQSNLVE